MLDVFGLFSVPTLYVLIGISILLIVAIILSIVAIAKSSAMKKKYNIMMEGSEGKSIEKLIKEYTDDVKLLKETYEDNTNSIKDIYDKMQYTFQKVGVVKYDAFQSTMGEFPASPSAIPRYAKKYFDLWKEIFNENLEDKIKNWEQNNGRIYKK